jgi:2-aminoethylphosphonate-pyruvate transaminase
MKAVMLAAGRGDRLRPVTDSMPKGLIEVGGQSLIERSLDLLLAQGITQTYIVTGYLGGMIRQRLGPAYRGMEIIYAENPDFERTGSMYSLSRLEGVLDDDILLLESDLLYEPAALSILVEAPLPDTILIAALLNEGDDVYVCTNAEGRVLYLGKTLPHAFTGQVAGCLVGISKYSRGFMEHLFATARKDYSGGCLTSHYEECVLQASLGHRPVYSVYAENLAWTEIDTQSDLRRAAELVYPRLKG